MKSLKIAREQIINNEEQLSFELYNKDNECVKVLGWSKSQTKFWYSAFTKKGKQINYRTKTIPKKYREKFVEARI